MKTYLIIFLITIGVTGYCQEICDNGIDDDGDGLIDLNDTSDCICSPAFPGSIIPNYSFEDTVCCPTLWSQLNCAKEWIQASSPTSDYYNTCNFIGDIRNSITFAPKPLFNGTGYVGFHDLLEVGGSYKEYVGACLNGGMNAGIEYKIEFQLAHGQGPLDVSVSLFATDDCTNLPFGNGQRNFGCPTNGPNWDELSTETVLLKTGEWNVVRMTFKPSKDYKAIVLGPSCNSDTIVNGVLPYYYLDHIIANESKLFNYFKLGSTVVSCKGEIMLYIPHDKDPTSIQWYRNGVAINGEKGSKFLVDPSEKGGLQARILFGDSCEVSQIFILDSNVLIPQEVKSKCPPTLEIYNVFTPGADGKNDTWKVDFEGYSTIQVDIYNRWGELVYGYNLPEDIDWNGRINNTGALCPNGNYFYILKLQNHYTGELTTANGLIQLIAE